MGGGGGWPFGGGGPEIPDVGPPEPPPGLGPFSDQALRATGQVPAARNYGWLEGFARSTLAGIPELVGVEAPEAIQDWRAGHPIAGTISQLIPGLAGPVAGARVGGALIGRAVLGTAARGMGATEAVVASLARAAPRTAQMPFTAGAAAGVIEMVPYEAARLAGAAAIGDEGSLSRVFWGGLTDLALGGVATGGMHWYRSTRVRDQDAVMQGLIDGYRGVDAPQERLYASYTARTGRQVSDEAMPQVEQNIARLEREIRTAVPDRGARFVDQLWEGADSDEMNRLFSSGRSNSLIRRTFTQGTEDGFTDRAAWEGIARAAEMPPDWQAHVQYPRVVEALTPEAQANVRQSLVRNLRNEADGWRITPEANTGLFVMSRELPNRQFVVFKTANPERFIKESIFEAATNRSQAYMKRVEGPLRRSADEALQAAVPDSVLSRTVGLQRDITAEATEIAGRTTREKFFEMLPEGMKRLGKEADEIKREVWDFVKQNIAPGDALFRNAPAAGALRLHLQGVYDLAMAKASAVVNGRPVVEAGKNLITRTVKPRAGVQGMLRETTEKEYETAFDAIANGGTLDSARDFVRNIVDDPAGQDRVMKLIEYMQRSSDDTAREIHMTEAVFDTKGFNQVQGNYGWSHAWTGRHRVNVVGDNGQIVGVGVGRSGKEAMESARNVARETHGVADARSYISNGAKADAELMDQIRKNREHVAGPTERMTVFRGGAAQRPTKEEFFNLFDTRVKGEYKYLADMISREHFAADVADVRRRYGDRVGDQIEYRQRALRGDKGAVDRVTNKILDKALRPWIGNNSADKLIQAYNKLEYANLVFLNPAYLMQNILTPIQTVLPGIANLINGNAGTWQRFMDFAPIITEKGVGGVRGMFAPLRLMSAAARSMARPTAAEADDLARAVSEGLISPRVLDEFGGSVGKFGQSIAEGFGKGSDIGDRSANALLNALKYMGTVPAARVEELTRAYAFLAGRHIAEARGIIDTEQMYQVAKRFTNRTMYQYAVQDRAKIFNGPAGSAFGLFKNWLFQNVNDWSLYGHEAYRRGNIAPLMWAMSGNAAIAGVGGTSVFGVADGLTRMFSDRGLMQHIYEAFGNGPDGNNMTDALYFGLPGLLGVSLQNQLSAPGSDPQQDINFLFNFVALRRAQKIGTLANYFVNEWRATGNPLASDRTWDMMNYAMGPRVFYKLMTEVEDGALRSIRDGRPITNLINEGDRWMNALGLQPTRIARAYEASTELFSRREDQRAATSRLGEAYARAIERQDQEAMRFILRRAIETNTDISAVARSAATRVRRQATPVLRNEFRRDPRSADLLEALDL